MESTQYHAIAGNLKRISSHAHMSPPKAPKWGLANSKVAATKHVLQAVLLSPRARVRRHRDFRCAVSSFLVDSDEV